MAPMERYTVSVSTPGATAFRLLVPIPPTSTVSSLASEVKRRASGHDNWPEDSDITLRLGGPSGPILYEFDILSDVIIDPKAETIDATPRIRKQSTVTTVSGDAQQNQHTSEASVAGSIKIRVITPALARAHRDVRSIPILRGSLTRNTTLRELKSHVSNHLSFPVSGPVQTGQECNCSLARQITERALLSQLRPRDGNPSLSESVEKLIIVHGRNKVQVLDTDCVEKSELLSAVVAELGGDVELKEIALIGGTLLSNASQRYSKLPVVSVCSKQRHGQVSSVASSRPTATGSNGLDLHTSECPIEISTLNMGLSLDEMCLTECVIDGILNIYVVERRLSGEGVEKESGKNAIFLESDAWRHPVIQSNRGVAMLLSSLRVLTERIGAKNMEHPHQDAILHVFYLLTRFPPAVRAVHILMNGKSPRASECAALAQAIYEVLKDAVPLQLIKADVGRYFEGTRLLFGLILEKAKHLKLGDNEQMPYISSLKVLDLRNTFTMEPIVHAVQTPVGLVEEGYYEAFQPGGILYWKTGERPLAVLPLDDRTKRIALLCGGVVPQITTFDLNVLSSSSGYAAKGGFDLVIPTRELSDLNHLSALCSRHNMSVLPPSALPSADAPSLTLDRTGCLAVYTGRAACAQPGKDISIFRPTSGGEETVDVSIITQLLVPILSARESDGTAIFDAFGDSIRRKFREPDEIVMVCVDCSNSMSEDSDFVEIKDDTDEEGYDSEIALDSDGEDPLVAGSANGTTFLCSTFDEMKTLLTEHESFDDMVGTVRDTAEDRRRDVATRLFGLLSSFTSQELTFRLNELEEFKKRVTSGYFRNVSKAREADIAKLKSLIAGLNSHKTSLCDFLIYRAANSATLDQDLIWNIGDAIPTIPKKAETPVNPLSEEEISIPPEYLCPISRDVMENPVFTTDGFTFDRNTIERWFQIRNSSPLTGLILENTDLRVNGELLNKVKRWIAGSDIIEAAPESPLNTTSRTRSTTQTTITVRFFSRLGDFIRKVPKTLSVSGLYRLAFRGMKGRQSKFQLHCKNQFLAPSDSSLSSAGVQNNSIFHINIPDESFVANTPNKCNEENQSDFEELCLIKVYHRTDQMLFSYWVSKKTTNSFASVIFKYWRHQAKNGSLWFSSYMLPWTSMSEQGDQHISGRVQDSWNLLSGFLNPYFATGKLSHEKVFADDSSSSSPDHEDEEGDVNMDGHQPAKPLVLKVYMSGKAPEKSGKNLTRLDVLKNMFDAFVNRLLAYNFSTHMGLITFQSSASISQSITHAVENFRHKVNRMAAHGDTALWDALALANDQLAEYARKFPNAKKRIICLSDGNDTKSTQLAHQVSLSLLQNNVVVDSFCLGDEDNIDLRTVSYLSGGYKFKPESLEQAMAICEMEPVLNQLERPIIALPRETQTHPYDPYLRFVFARDMAAPEIVTTDIFPQRREHPNINDNFVQLSSMSGNAQEGQGSVNTHSDANLRTPRILTEIRNIVANPHPQYDVYLSESNMSFWKVIIQGPPDSAYSTGTFVIYLHMEEDYPAFPPKCRFTTPVYHPNINRHGKVCHSILDRNWTSDTTNLQLINTIYSLLLVPEFSDPINAVVTLNYHWDEVAFRDEVKAHIEKHATKSRTEWKSEIVGLVN